MTKQIMNKIIHKFDCMIKDLKILYTYEVNKHIKQNQNISHIIYNNNKITYFDIGCFIVSTRNKNNESNKLRELIICAIINKKIPEEYYCKSKQWLNLKENIDKYIVLLFNNYINQHNEIDNINPQINNIICIHKGGRNNNYDFKIVINENYEFNIEFKFNISKISESPQFVSPMKPSQYLSSSYEEYYYDNYLQKLCDLSNVKIPDKNTYINDIHSPKPKFIKELQDKYYNGCSKSSKYTKKENDIDFYNTSVKLSNESISNFIKNTDLNIQKLSDYLINTQKNKYYMMYKNEQIHIDDVDLNNYILISYTKTYNSYIATSKNGKKIKILLRWKNGNGIAYPAFQIS